MGRGVGQRRYLTETGVRALIPIPIRQASPLAPTATEETRISRSESLAEMLRQGNFDAKQIACYLQDPDPAGLPTLNEGLARLVVSALSLGNDSTLHIPNGATASRQIWNLIASRSAGSPEFYDSVASITDLEKLTGLRDEMRQKKRSLSMEIDSLLRGGGSGEALGEARCSHAIVSWRLGTVLKRLRELAPPKPRRQSRAYWKQSDVVSATPPKVVTETLPEADQEAFRIPLIGPASFDLPQWGARSITITCDEKLALASDEEKRAAYESFDRLLLFGGSDIPIAWYDPEYLLCDVSARDVVEHAFLRFALTDGKPTFGICRGMQILNVAAGGSLYTDLSEIGPQIRRERHRGARHLIRIDPTSNLVRRLQIALPEDGSWPTIEVNSYHHQCVRRVADGFRPVAFSVEDDIIEAIEHTENPDVFGVQFHPERMMDQESFQRLMQSFIKR